MKRKKFLIVKVTSGSGEEIKVEALCFQELDYKSRSIRLDLVERLLEDAGYEVGWCRNRRTETLQATVYLASTLDGTKPLGTYSYLWDCRKKEIEVPPETVEEASSIREKAWHSVVKAFDGAIEAATEYNKIYGVSCITLSNDELKLAMGKELSIQRKQLTQARNDFREAMMALRWDKGD